MAKDTKPLEDWNANAQRTLEQTMEHTRGVLGQYGLHPVPKTPS